MSARSPPALTRPDSRSAGPRRAPLTRSGSTAGKVAEAGYDALKAGRLMVVNEARLAFLTGWVIPFLPRRMVLGMVRRMQTR